MKKNYLYIFILIQFCSGVFYSQTQEIDSLKILLNLSSNDTNKIKILNKIGAAAIYNDSYDTARKYALISKSISEKISFKTGLSRAYDILGNINYFDGNYSESLEYNLKSLKIKEDLKDKKGIANSYNNIGNVYYQLKEYSKAIKNHKQALSIREKIKDSVNIGFSFNNLGNVYREQKNFNESLKYHLEALKIKKSNGNIKEIAYSLNNIGVVYIDLGNFNEAIKFHSEALNISQKINSLENIEISYANLGKAYFNLKKYEIAEDYSKRAIDLAETIEDKETILDAKMCLSLIYEQTKDYKKSLKYYHEAIELRDSIFNNENIQNAVQTQLQFDFEKKEMIAKKEQEEKDIEIRAESKKQKWILFLVSCILILAIIFAIITYRGYLQKQKANKLILLQKQEVEKQRNKTEEKNKDITSSITYAKRIQQAILPSSEIIKEKFPDSFILYKPKDIVAGDFYWVSDAVTKHQESFMMVAVADCTGHGVPGALMSVIGNNFLRICEREPTVNRPSEALDFINVGISKTLRQEYSKSTIQDGMDMVFVAIDYSAMLLHFAGAKNSIYIIRDGLLTEYKGDKHPIGAYVGEEMKKFTNHSISVKKNDCVYLFTDGYADQFGGAEGKKFMYSRFKKLLTENSHLSMEEQHHILSNTFDNWKADNEQVDDVCVFGFRV
ncbi:MAG: tetratricopeptide repeat protein [Bacteroidota bacterium]|nr:tetratricopeptide repeat protein [Bacteroidota bacterium]